MKTLLFLAILITAEHCLSQDMDGDPVLFYANVDKLEILEDGKQAFKSHFWLGRDSTKFAVDIDMERHDQQTKAHSFSLAFRQPISPFWDFDAGVHREQEPGSPATRIRLALRGLMPFFIETSAALHLSKKHAHLEVSFEHELPLAADWVVKSGLELDVYNRSDNVRQISSGLGQFEARLALVYERFKHLHPYLAIEHKRNYSTTSVKETQAALGLSLWF